MRVVTSGLLADFFVGHAFAYAGQGLVVAPRLRQGALPPQSPIGYGGGEVVLELRVDATGAVRRFAALVTTASLTEAVTQAARLWRFTPAGALVDGMPTDVPRSVLMIAVFRPPSL